VAGAAPIFHDVMEDLQGTRPPEPFAVPRGIVSAGICPLSGKRPGRSCPGRLIERFVSGTEPASECDYHTAAGVALPPEYLTWAADGRAASSSSGNRSSPAAVAIRFP